MGWVSRRITERQSGQIFRLAADPGNATREPNLQNISALAENAGEESAQQYKIASNAKDADAQYGLGFSYQYGFNVEKNYKQAVKLYQLAAHAGNAAAQVNLGAMYEYGLGVEKDYNEAKRLYQLAADL